MELIFSFPTSGTKAASSTTLGIKTLVGPVATVLDLHQVA